MTILDDFYTIETTQQVGEQHIFELALNPNHSIYKGHFPDQPVMPGVCMVQLVTELSSKAIAQPLQLQTATQLKFLIPIVPQQYPKIHLHTQLKVHQDRVWKVVASIQADEQIFFKFKGSFSLQL